MYLYYLNLICNHSNKTIKMHYYNCLDDIFIYIVDVINATFEAIKC